MYHYAKRIIAIGSVIVIVGAGCSAPAPMNMVANVEDEKAGLLEATSTPGQDISPPVASSSTVTVAPVPAAVPSKPLSSDAPVRADRVNAPNLPLPSTPEPESRPTDSPLSPAPAPVLAPEPTPQPAPQPAPTPSVRSFTLTAKNWEFVPAAITVDKGDTVKITITSTDVTHGFSLPDFNVRATLEPNQPKTLEFTADKAGTFSFRCSVFCGDGHSGMTGTLIVK